MQSKLLIYYEAFLKIVQTENFEGQITIFNCLFFVGKRIYKDKKEKDVEFNFVEVIQTK